MSFSAKLFTAAVSLVVAGVAVAVSSGTPGAGSSQQQAATLEQTIANAATAGNLNAVVAALVSNGVNVDELAAALVNAGVSPDVAIAAMKSAGVSDAKISSSLTAAIPASNTAALTSLNIALANADITPTAAGPVAGGPAAGSATAGAAPFANPSSPGGGGAVSR